MKLHVIVDADGKVLTTMPVVGTIVGDTMFGGASPTGDRPPVGRNDIALAAPVGGKRPPAGTGAFRLAPPVFTGVATASRETHLLYEITQSEELAAHVARGDPDAFHAAIAQTIVTQRLKPISTRGK